VYWINQDFHTRYESHYRRVMRCFSTRPQTLGEMITTVIETHGEAEAIVCDSHRLTYRQLDDKARRFASVLLSAGIQPGDRVALNLGNGIEFPIAWLATLYVGAVSVPAGTRQQTPELEFIYNNCEVSAVVFDAEVAAVQPATNATPSVKLQVVADNNSANGFHAIVDRTIPLAEIHQADQEDCAMLMYTSGTTGKPKGAMLSHLGLIHSALHWINRFSFQRHERTIVSVPVSHVTGLAAQLLPMFACAGCCVMQREFHAPAFLELACRERLSFAIMVPAMYKLLLLRGDFNDEDLSAWRVGAFGGAPMPQATIVEMAARLPGLALANSYGATETSSPSTVMPLEATRDRTDSIGTAVVCADLLIMNDEGMEVTRGESGEIWIAGPHIISGYWKRPDADESSFVNGYWKSGDIGRIDDEGFVNIFDRKKDMINRGGYKIFCVEVENVIADHPGIEDVALVSVACEVLGERSCACVTTSGSLLQSGLADYLSDKVADYKIPDFVLLYTEMLPRNANGKIQKAVLREAAKLKYT